MILTAALLCLVADAAPPEERTLAAFVVLTPPRATGAPPFGELLASVEAPLLELTGLRLRSPEQLGLDLTVVGRCREARTLSCIARHVQLTSAAEVAVVLTLLPFGPRQHRVSMALVDIAQAAELAQTPDPARAEDELYAASPRLEATELDAGDPRAMADWVEAGVRPQTLAGDARPWLRPRAELRVGRLGGATEILVDGVSFGSRGPGDVVVRGLRPGRRLVTLMGPSASVEGWVSLEPGRSAHFGGEVAVERVPASWSPARAFIPAATLLAGAGALTALALARPGPRCVLLVEGGCLAFSGDGAEERPDQRATWAATSGLVGAGVVWLLLETVLHDEERSVWIDVGLAGLVGAAISVVPVVAR